MPLTRVLFVIVMFLVGLKLVEFVITVTRFIEYGLVLFCVWIVLFVNVIFVNVGQFIVFFY